MATRRRIKSFLTSGTFTAPYDGVYSYFGIGAGGGGTMNVGAGAGAASAWVAQHMYKDETADISIGEGASDTDGGDTTVTYDSTVILKAKGGKSGTNGGIGGQATDCVGDTKFSGTNGQTGTGTTRRYGGNAAGTIEDGQPGGGNYFGGCSGNLAAVTHRLFGSGGHSRSDEAAAGRPGVVMIYYDEEVTGFPVIKAWAYSRSAEPGSTNHVINMPSFDVGDLLVCFFSCDSVSTRTFTPTSGWTLLAQQANSGTEAVRGLIYYKIAEGSDTLTITTNSTEGSSAIAIAVKDGGTPTATGIGGNSTNADPPEHDIGVADACLWIAAVGRDLDAGNSFITDGSSGWDDFHYLTSKNQINGADVAIVTKNANASSQNPGAFTSTTEQWWAFTIAIPFTGTTKTRHRVTII